MRLQSSISASAAVQVKPHPGPQQHVFHEHSASYHATSVPATKASPSAPMVHNTHHLEVPIGTLHTLAFQTADELASSVCNSLLVLGTVSVRVTDQAECLDIFLLG